jgi:glycosyltransferase involved in cell wall biosynthesis
MIKIPEYMALGKPIASYDLRESRVSAGDAAAYAAPGDPEDLARCLDELVADPRRRAWMGEAGLARVRDSLAWQHQVPALLAAYERAVAGGEAGAYSTVTVLARLRGWSTLSPRSRAIR